jgi:hypothetical protein
MTEPRDRTTAQGEPGDPVDGASVPAGPPPQPGQAQRRGSDLDAATGTLVGAALGALIWVLLVLLYLWLR